jgi:hypothetical protein
MKQAFAVELSERALIFLAERPEELQRFLTASGLDGHTLLARTNESAILGAAINYVANDESLAKDFSIAENLKPGILLNACAILDPHGSMSW